MGPSSARPDGTLYRRLRRTSYKQPIHPCTPTESCRSVKNSSSARGTLRSASDVRHRIPADDAGYPAIDRRGLSLRSFDSADPAAKIAPNQEIPLGSLECPAQSIQTKVADALRGNTTAPSREAACSTSPMRQTAIGYRPLRQSIVEWSTCIDRILAAISTR